MTREEAIARIKDHMIVHKMYEPRAVYISEALDMAIKALSQEPCNDTVSREAILSKIKEVCFSKKWTQFRIDNGSNGQRDYLINFIEKLPPVTQRSGKWLITPMSHIAYCSECDYLFKNIPASIVKQFKYCPNCGMKMESEE